ncbi:MAG TPA: cellulase N-terminal Ig-like domain-containing protein, partial [Megamonas funiformis]|nr:cellulase N-terminal Ig-like domain-containing protein [Megamonas funiformis]
MYNKKKLSQIILSGLMAVSFSSISLPIEAADMGLHVDQVGYLPNYSKVAMVTDSNDTTFEIIDTKDNKVVFKGNLSEPKYDKISEETLRKADFSSLNVPGTYILKVGNRESYDFVIGDDVYDVPMVQSWRSYTLSR